MLLRRKCQLPESKNFTVYFPYYIDKIFQCNNKICNTVRILQENIISLPIGTKVFYYVAKTMLCEDEKLKKIERGKCVRNIVIYS